MRSIEGLRSDQRGVSLIEAVVAAALMGIGVVGGLTAWDTAAMSASEATRMAWANCIVRAELDAIMSSTYVDPPGSYAVPEPYASKGTVAVGVTMVRGRPGSAGEEQQVTVQAFDPLSKRSMLARATALRTPVLAGTKSMGDPQVLSDVLLGCPRQ